MSPLKGRKDESRKKKDVSYSGPNINNPIKTSTLTMGLEKLIKPGFFTTTSLVLLSFTLVLRAFSEGKFYLVLPGISIKILSSLFSKICGDILWLKAFCKY